MRWLALRVLLINQLLQADMLAMLDLVVAAGFVGVEIVRQRAFDVFGQGVVALDQVGIVAIHQADEVGEAGGGLGMQAAAERGGGGGKVGDLVGDIVVEQTRLDA